MTTLTGIELSKRVAELYGIDVDSWGGVYKTWLHEDSERCFELAAEYGLVIDFSTSCICEEFDMYGSSKDIYFNENPDCNFKKGPLKGKDYLNAARNAILQCLVKMKEG